MAPFSFARFLNCVRKRRKKTSPNPNAQVRERKKVLEMKAIYLKKIMIARDAISKIRSRGSWRVHDILRNKR